MTCPDAASLPPVPKSVQTVYCVLRSTNRLTMKDLQDRSHLARRTVYGAVSRLKEMGLLRESPNLRDTRQSWYFLA